MENKPTERKGASETKSSSSTNKDIWLMLSSMDPPKRVTSSSTTDDNNAEGVVLQPTVDERDTFTLLLGSKSAGKTSLTTAYVHRGEDKSGSDDVKPTTGLEYLFVRQSGAVAHIWELASARCVPEMMRVPLAPERILQGAAVITVDLSNPGDALPNLIKWLTTLHKIVGDVLKTKEKNPVEKASIDRLRKQAMERYGNDHTDKDDVTPVAIPVLIVGTKYDLFAKEDSARRKPLLQALRFFAHLYGATLLLTTVKEKPCVTQMRSVFKSYVFGTSANLRTLKREVESNSSKPLFVPAGSDTFSDIGLPDGARKEDLLGTPASDVDAKAKPWKKFVGKVFPASGTVSEGWDDQGNNAAVANTSNEFPEPNIDRARQRKLDELTRYHDARKKLEKPKPLKA